MERKTEQTVEKPLGLLKQEFIEGVVQQINNSQLPLLVVEYILKDILQELNQTIIQQDSAEISKYEAELATLNKVE